MSENEKSDRQLKSLAECPADITVVGQPFKIYPLSIGKISMLTGILEALAPLIDIINEDGKVDISKLGTEKIQKIKESVSKCTDEISRAFAIVTFPAGKAVQITDESVEFAKWNLEPIHIVQIISIIIDDANFGDLLKNAMSPRKTAKKSSPGENTSDLL